MWKVLEDKNVKKQLRKIPKEILEKYEFWKNVVEFDGPKGLRRLPAMKDHALKGEWSGARSSYLNKQWRVIYFIKSNVLEIIVLEVNSHDYGKKT